jgi:hypothetical protein
VLTVSRVEHYPVQAHGLEQIQIDVWPSQDVVLSSQTVEESSDEELYDAYYRIPSEVGDHVSAWKRHLCLNCKPPFPLSPYTTTP